MGDLGLLYTGEVFPRIVRVSDVKATRESGAVVSRQKRNIFYQNGLKLCGQETADQVVAGHLSYFHLRGKFQPQAVEEELDGASVMSLAGF